MTHKKIKNNQHAAQWLHQVEGMFGTFSELSIDVIPIQSRREFLCEEHQTIVSHLTHIRNYLNEEEN
tara:strand:- start:166 stop:366 length:201 start_codon:yes stop_codon:yes gene_type:complete